MPSNFSETLYQAIIYTSPHGGSIPGIVVLAESLVELLIPSESSSIVLRLQGPASRLSERLPLEVVLRKWKEEIYFSTPLDPSDFEGLSLTSRVSPGRVYYWPPGRALCIFYGYSQIYTPGHPAGEVVGPIRFLDKVVDETRGELAPYKPEEELSSIAGQLASMGYTVSTPLLAGDRVVSAHKSVNGRRLAFLAVREAYGVYIESEPLFSYSRDVSTLRVMERLSRILAGASYARLDIDEEGNVVISASVEENHVSSAVSELEKYYPRIIDTMLE